MLLQEFDSKLNILYVNITETDILMINEIINHYNWIENNNSLPRELRVLIDVRSIEFKIRTNEIHKSFESLKKALTKYRYIKEAILIDKPYAAVIATLFADGTKFRNYNFKIFTTKDAANTWLNI